MTHEITDLVPRDCAGAREIGFAIPERYNASRILFDNLAKGFGDRPALIGPAGARSYNELCAEASRWGHGLQSLGLKRGDRVLLFLDDTPAYPAAFFGAVRAGFMPLLINTLTPPDLLQFYLADSGASVAVADAEFSSRFDAVACKDTPLRTLIVVNGAAKQHAAPDVIAAEAWLQTFPAELAEADTHRNEMAFWMYSSGSTGRPKGIVHLQHDMAYSEAAFAQNVLKLTPDDICFSVPKIFFAYGFGNAITFPFSAGATRNKDGRDVADDEEGILWVRGDSNTPLYWNRPDKSAETIREGGWIYTGDRFVRDADGFHFFRGRADDLIKISGQWVYPLEVELCLAEHPDVRECAVYAAELADRRMTLKAVVVMNRSGFDANDTTKKLQDFVKAKLLPYKYPREVRFLDELPKTGTGKIDRQALLRMYT